MQDSAHSYLGPKGDALLYKVHSDVLRGRTRRPDVGAASLAMNGPSGSPADYL